MNIDVAMSPEAAGLSLNQKPSKRILSLVHEGVILADRVIDVRDVECLTVGRGRWRHRTISSTRPWATLIFSRRSSSLRP